MQGSRFLYTMPAGSFSEADNRSWHHSIQERRDDWSKQHYPELMRLRDYFSFMQFAKEEKAIVIVCDSNPAAGRWISEAGVRCYDGRQPIPSRILPPNEGLLAADPADERLIKILNDPDDPLSYADYVAQLSKQGLRVLGADAGYLIEDKFGNRLHESYRLHGVYDASSDESLWIHGGGERLRAALNRHLGAELVRFGPHDDWEFRNDKKVAGLLRGPQLPAIEFRPNQEIENLLDVKSLASRFLDPGRWAELYPDHRIEEAS